jgi:hypothetical protein
VALKAKPFIFDGLRFHREHTAWLSADHPSFETLQMQYPNTPLYATVRAIVKSQGGKFNYVVFCIRNKSVVS